MPNRSALRPEFSRPVPADSVQAREVVQTIEASAEEREVLARRFELEAIGRLVATVRLRRVRGGTMVRVVGELDADVVQTCVASLESVPAKVSERFDALFAPSELIPDDDDDDVLIDTESLGEDLPEPIVDGRIDIGELTAQHLSLALDPYPRAPGAVFEPFEEHDEPDDDAGIDEDPRPSPFAALEKLKRPR
jgi:uncharacterized metal-binding protein YceD (DUF177 family)